MEVLNDDLFTLPLVLDSTDNHSVSLTNCNGLQLEVKDQSVPLVILENGDLMLQNITDFPLLLSNSLANGNYMTDEDVFIKDSDYRSNETTVDNRKEDGMELKSPSSEHMEINTDNLLIEDLVETVIIYKCRLCPYKATDRASLSAHLKALHLKNAEKGNCSIAKENSNKEALSEKMAFMCGKCSEAFASFSDWRSHMAMVHEIVMGVKDTIENEEINGGPPVDLETMQKKSKPQEITPKAKYVIPTKEKKIVCPVESCLIRLSSRDLIEKHRECHVSSRNFACPHCSQPFRKWYECANHLWKSHSEDVDLYSCPNCEFKTALRAKLEVHVKTHYDERGYLCTECGKTFKQAFQLQNHRVTHLKVSDPASVPNWSRKQECSQCKRTFCDSKALKKHIQSVHSNLRPYVCNVCGHTSALKNRMTLHLRQHTGEKPFSCPFCPFITGDQNCLRRHAWRHSRVRPYSCPHCEYSCIQSSSLKKHIKTQHPASSEVFSCRHCSFTSLSKNSLDNHIIKNHDGKTEPEKETRVIYVGALSETVEGTDSGQLIALPVEILMDDEESQNFIENTVIDTGGITIPAELNLPK